MVSVAMRVEGIEQSQAQFSSNLQVSFHLQNPNPKIVLLFVFASGPSSFSESSQKTNQTTQILLCGWSQIAISC